MLDAQFIREHVNEVKINCRNRHVQADVDGVVRLDEERRRVLQETQTLQQRQNELKKLTPQEKDP
ncbi:MAG TPA: serine--tRNA ligase, partial [Gemmataceae bacterium]|nr:serine--tRNA ligase [Gemmataceae bacterium]